MDDSCKLRELYGIEAACDGNECVYWRAAGHLDLVKRAEGCAIQYFGLLGEPGSEIAEWLLSVKTRIEDCPGISNDDG